MDEKEIVAKLQEFQEMGNTELAHIFADDLLCKFLKELGYEAVAVEFDKVPKWYS